MPKQRHRLALGLQFIYFLNPNLQPLAFFVAVQPTFLMRPLMIWNVSLYQICHVGLRLAGTMSDQISKFNVRLKIPFEARILLQLKSVQM